MINVYEQVSTNKTKSAVIISLFIGFVIAATWIITTILDLDPSLILFASLFSFASSVTSFYFGDRIVLSLNGARPANRQEFFDFYTATENLAMANRLPPPKIYVIDSPSPNAFATGRDPQHAVVCATTGLLQKLNRSQLEAVIAHELSHIANFDTRLMTLVSVLVGSLSILSDLLLRQRRYSSNDDRRHNSGPLMVVGLILLVLSPLIAQLIQLAISRRREFLADASAVKTTRQPASLIEALEIISTDSSKANFASPATAPLYITNPFRHQKLASLFSTHPPISERVAALKSML